jgi:hypothetical protein
MDVCIEKLLSIAGKPLIATLPSRTSSIFDSVSDLTNELYNILVRKNGFFAFESALHFFPLGLSELTDIIDLESWNSINLWRKNYISLPSECIFFAEDVFGCQFCIHKNMIQIFDPETGEFEELAPNFESWASALLEDYETLTGYPIAHEWQKIHGILSLGKRLIPKIPFVLGGKFNIENLYLLDSIEGMNLRADIAQQIKYLPDGEQVSLKIH